jgi:hypothetical protein
MKRPAAIVVFALLIVAGVLAARGASWYRTTDFYCLYEGSRSLVQGHDPYDEAWWATAVAGVFPNPTFIGGDGSPGCPGRYGYPLWTAVALLPIGLLPVEIAAITWATLSIAATVFGMAWAWRAVNGPHALAALFAIVVIMSQPFWILLISGQMSGVELGLAGAAALGLARARTARAGAAIAAMAVKPQVVIFTVPAVVLVALRRSPRLAVAIFVSLAVMSTAPLLFVMGWHAEWLGELGSRRLRVAQLLPTTWGLAADVFGNVALGAALAAFVLVAVVALVRRHGLSPLDVFVLSLPISLFVTPYAWSYDHLVFAVCWAYLLAVTPSRGFAHVAGLIGVVVLADLAPWALYALSFTRGGETLSAIMPACTAVLVAIAARARAGWPTGPAGALRTS